MHTAAEIIRELVGETRYPIPGWEAFAYYLENHKGSSGKAFPQLDIHHLWQTIEQDELDGEWLRAFSDREDVRIAAGAFASDLRGGGRARPTTPD